MSRLQEPNQNYYLSKNDLFISVGRLHYDENKLIVEADRELGAYYYSLVPKFLRINHQRYNPHISVVRKEVPPKMEHWGKYEGEEIEFFYDPFVWSGTVYYWINVFCSRLEEVRLELGLPVASEYTLPPEGFAKCFHLTIGNTKVI